MANAKVDDLLLFSKVAEQKNFSRVADQLGMVKSMVSKRISRLESELGVQLLHRSTRRMSRVKPSMNTRRAFKKKSPAPWMPLQPAQINRVVN